MSAEDYKDTTNINKGAFEDWVIERHGKVLWSGVSYPYLEIRAGGRYRNGFVMDLWEAWNHGGL